MFGCLVVSFVGRSGVLGFLFLWFEVLVVGFLFGMPTVPGLFLRGFCL